MRIRRSLTMAVAAAMAIGTAGIATAHAPGVADGHIDANTNYGLELVGYSPLQGVQDGRYTDVWAHEGHAYVGSFQNPTCSNDGVYIADIRDPQNPEYIGQIHSAPGTRVNDVKVTDVGDMDVLIFTHEVCGTDVAASSASQMGRDRSEVITDDGLVGQGSDGISLYDVTKPNAPRKLAAGFLETEVHNTFPWTNEEGRTFLLVVDDFNVDDTWIVEITDPRDPVLLTKTGIGTWLDEGIFDLETSELFLGTFATPLLHDVWVEYNEAQGRWEAVLSYWDAGFITLDVSDPADPVFIAHSDYPAQDPVLAAERTALFGGAPEGNAHAAVFGGDDNEFIFGGDEDFDASAVTLTAGGESIAANNGSDTPPPPQDPIEGELVFVGLACGESLPVASDPSAIALIERGACAFTTKAAEVTAAGYAAGIVFNRPGVDVGCNDGIGMLVEGTIPMVSITRGQGFDLMGLTCVDDDETPLSGGGTEGETFGTASLSSAFVGWGYFWALNNDPAGTTVPGTLASEDGSTSVGHLGTIGYYAPAEIADPQYASGAGDLSMHNLETDMLDRDRTFVSWYSLGMRVLEYRPGHFHTNANGEGSYSWNIHEVGRWIAGGTPAADAELAPFVAQHGLELADLQGSNFWGVTQTEIDGTRYVLGSDRNTGLFIFEYACDEDPQGPLYCGDANGG